MGLRDWFRRKTPLQAAIERGLKPGGDLREELANLDDDYSVAAAADAEAICEALEATSIKVVDDGFSSSFHPLIALFQDVAGTECEAYPVLCERGLPLIEQRVYEALQQKGCERADDDILFALKILAMYGTQSGTEAVAYAALLPFCDKSFLWSIVLRGYSEGHPHREYLFERLAKQLPANFLAVSLLDAANAAMLAGAGGEHPFDSIEGITRLEAWLTDSDEEHFSYAVSATCALPHLQRAERDALLAIALEHPSIDVQLEAAWVAAKLGRESGKRWLARMCLDVNLSARAKRYLEELGLEAEIPPDAAGEAFAARSEFAEWLAHPSELGVPPDEVEIYDHRVMGWYPDRTPLSLWLIRYVQKDRTGLGRDSVGVGMVGSVTFCLFTFKLEQRPPEDGYTIHCYWENQDKFTETDVEDGSHEYDGLLRQHSLDGISDARVVKVVEPAASLKYPQALVGLAEAKRNGESGWIVLDGPRSRWYAAADMPEDNAQPILRIHFGRWMLNLTDEPERRSYLKPAAPPRPPDEIVARYEQLLAEAGTSPAHATKALWRNEVISSAFDDYVEARAAICSDSPAVSRIAAFERLWTVAEMVDEPDAVERVFGWIGPIGSQFDSYVEALVAENRRDEFPSFVARLRKYWKDEADSGRLGRKAFELGFLALAEELLLISRNNLERFQRVDEIDALAEIWTRSGRANEAKQMLVEAMQQLTAKSRAAAPGRDEYAEYLQSRREAYLRLFPEQGAAELQRLGLSAS